MFRWKEPILHLMYDCLIIGGGAIGLSLAYELARHNLRVRVIDQNEPGQQTSWAGAGILPPANPNAAHDAYEQLCGLSHQLHPKWAADLRAETSIDNGFRACGGLHVARRAGEAAALVAAMRQLQEDGIRVERVDPTHLRELEPALRPPGDGFSLRAAYLLPDESQLRNPRHLKALLSACRHRGVEMTGQVMAQRFQQTGSRVLALESSAGVLRAARFCVTTGAWTRLLLSQLDVHLEIHPWRGQIALLSGSPGLLQRVINEGPRYLVPRDDGRVLSGSTVEDVGFDNRTTPEAIQELVQFAVDLVPALAQAKLERSWSGLRPRTGDGLPFLGPVPGVDNLWVAAGHFRSGIHLSPGTAVVMSQLIRGEQPQVDLRPFRLDRE